MLLDFEAQEREQVLQLNLAVLACYLLRRVEKLLQVILILYLDLVK